MPDLLTLEESAKYFGCTPRLLLRLKRWGWLKSWEETIRKRCKLNETHYERWRLDVLAIDYLLSMSMYDLLFVRVNNRDSVETIAASRGLPLLVAKLIQESEFTDQAVELIRTRRRHLDAEDKSVTSLSKYMRRLVDTSPAARQQRQKQVQYRFWKNGGPPIRNCETSFDNLYKKATTDWLGGAGRAHYKLRPSDEV